MGVIVLLIAAGGLVAGLFLVGFIWAVRAGQFDDTVSPPVRMLLDETDGPDSAQRSRGVPHVQSRS